MAKFEVFIPAAGSGTFDLTFRVEADNWLAALNTGLKKIGEKGGAGTGFLVDIQDDNSIHVTDPKSQRVFRITEQEQPEESTQTGAGSNAAPETTQPISNPFDPLPGRSTQIDLPAVAAPIKLAPAEPATLPPTPALEFVLPPANTAVAKEPPKDARPSTEPELAPAGAKSGPHPRDTIAGLPPHAQEAAKGAAQPNMQATPSMPLRPPSFASIPPPTWNPPSKPPTARPKSGVNRRPSGVAKNVTEVPREQARPPTGRIGREKPVQRENIDDTLAELFERVQELEEFHSPDEAMDFVLDLAMEKIAAESGSIFLADLSTNDLTLGTARGPKSKELLRLNPRVPMGVGIVGFCSQEGVSIAISDAQRDPRFFKAISERIGYATKTILCVPMIRGGRSFGCLEVLNKKTSNRFTEGEVAILAYLADATARYLETLA